MPPFVVSHTNAQRKIAAKIRRLRSVNKLSVSAACRVVGVNRAWFYDHKDLIEQPTIKQKQPA